MITHIVAKLAGEAMLSLYPMIVKLIKIPMHTQMWSRFSTYAIISAMFVNWDFIAKHVLSFNGWMLMLVTLLHVYSSYEGFYYLESGVSYSVFYLYPIMILLMAGETISPWMFLALFGTVLLYSTSTSLYPKVSESITSQLSESASEHPSENKNVVRGYLMILVAAFTEAWIYFLVRNLPTSNSWNHVFLSYVLGALGLSVYEYTKVPDAMKFVTGMIKNNGVLLALGLNAGIGLFGYLLRFYATTRLSPQIYAPLSYFGVFMAYVYGLVFGTDTFSWTKLVGTFCILISNFMTMK